MEFIMAKMDDRMELIGSAILGQAKQEARDLIDKANATRDHEISAFEEDIVNNMFGRVQTKAGNMRLKTIKSIAKNQLEAHRTLLLHRCEKTEEILGNVRENLVNHAKTAKYKNALLKRAGDLKDKYDHSGSVIIVAEKDMPLAGEIKEILGGGTVKADPSIRLGGFKLLNRKAHVLIDETLDERLDEQKAWLLENCGLKIL